MKTTGNRAIIIGSGVAGLAAAIRLAVKGYEVTVMERNSSAGGKLRMREENGYLFDLGPSLFTQPQNIVELFALAEEPIEDYFSFRNVPISCKYFYPNGKQVNAYTQADAFAKELAEQVNEDPDAVRAYLRDANDLYAHVGQIFVNHSLHKRKTWLHKRILPALKQSSWQHLFRSMHRFNQKRFKQPETVQLFNRYATYNGSNPYQAPAMLTLIPHLELNEGTFYPQGGMISITRALQALAEKKGVQFRFNTSVDRIIHHEGRVRGVVAEGINYDADIVVSNADIYFTYLHLLQDSYRAKKVLRQERSSSAFIFYWGIGTSFPELHLHNIFFSNEYKTEFDSLFKGTAWPNDPTAYINITSKMEEGQAPAGKENWFVMVNAPAHRGQNWDAITDKLRDLVLNKIEARLGKPVRPFIETEFTLTPAGIEQQTSSYMGSLYGTSSNSRFAAFLRHPNFSTHIRGLFCCGGSVHPGGGIPLCLKSGQIVADLVPNPTAAKSHA